MRVCPQCGEEKPLSEFPLRGRTRHGDRRYGYCKRCHAAYQRRSKLKREYGMTEDDFDALMAHQGGVCAICGQPPADKRLSVDHSHDWGVVRGLLCSACNGVLGRWADDADRFAAAAAYLSEPPAFEVLGHRCNRTLARWITPEWLAAAAQYLGREA